MYMMYVDESGDPGLANSPTTHFVLTGLVVHESKWNACLDSLITFRKSLRTSFELLMREEIHASHFINRPGALVRIPRNDRLSILRFFADELVGLSDLRLINVIVDKQGKPAGYDVFEQAWQALIQRFENTLQARNFAGSGNAKDWGMVLPDQTDTKRLTTLLRKMRKYNPIPNRAGYPTGYWNLLVSHLVEDPYFKESDHSYFIQASDLAAFLLFQAVRPSSYMRIKGGDRYFRRLDPILCKQASNLDPQGIVRL